MQDYIDVVESHKQLDSIKKTKNEGKYNSKKLDKETKLTFVFLGWHFQTTSSKKMVKEGKLDNGGASWKKLGLYLHLMGDEVLNLGYKKIGFIHQVVSHNKSTKNVGEITTRRLKPISSNTTPPNVLIVFIAASLILFNPPAHVMHMFAIEDFLKLAQIASKDIKTTTFR